MDPAADHPRAPEDYLVSAALALTWPVYVIGGLYVLGPVLAVALLAVYAARLYLAGTGASRWAAPAPPAGVWIWMAGMAAMLVALEVAHVANGLGIGQTIKSTIGWAKGWALFFLFPLAGACLHIRVETLLRAAGYVALMTLALTPVFVLAARVGLPETLYVSPFRLVGGPGPEFFAVSLYSIEPTDGSARFRFFTPWSPAAGFIANMYLLFALADRRRFWRVVGVTSALAVIVLSKSRLGLAAAMVIWPTVWAVGRLNRPGLWLLGAAGAVIIAPVLKPLIDRVHSALDGVKSMRADSTRVREALGEIAMDRWRTEAPVWGHGVVERGPHVVEFMPIGSHHTWYGLFFVKGAVGVAALALPLFWSLIEFALLAGRSVAGQIAFGMVLLMALYTVGENLEILAYLMWPGLIVMGVAMREAAEARIEAV